MIRRSITINYLYLVAVTTLILWGCRKAFPLGESSAITAHNNDCLESGIGIPAAKPPSQLYTIGRNLRQGIKAVLKAKTEADKQKKFRDLLNQQILANGGIRRSQLRALVVDLISDETGPCQLPKCLNGLGFAEDQIDTLLDQIRLEVLRDSRSATGAARTKLEVLLGSLKDDRTLAGFNSLGEFSIPTTPMTTSKFGITQWQSSQLSKSQSLNVAAIKNQEVLARFEAKIGQNSQVTLSQFQDYKTGATANALQQAFQEDLNALRQQSQALVDQDLLAKGEGAGEGLSPQDILLDDPELRWLAGASTGLEGEAAFAASLLSAQSKAIIAQAAYRTKPQKVGNLVAMVNGSKRQIFKLRQDHSTEFMKVWSGHLQDTAVVIIGLSGTRFDITTMKANLESTFFTPYLNPLFVSLPSFWDRLYDWNRPAVQLGFANLWKSHAPLVQKSIEASLADSGEEVGAFKAKRVYLLVCGHSLGGAVAQLAGVDLASYLAQQGISHLVQVAAFNPPKVGNRGFARLAEATLSHFNSEHSLDTNFKTHLPMLKMVKFHRKNDVVRLFPLLSTEIHDFAGIPVDEPRYAANIIAPPAPGPWIQNHSLTRWIHHDLSGKRSLLGAEEDFLARSLRYSTKAAYAPHLLTAQEIQFGHELYFQSYRFW